MAYGLGSYPLLDPDEGRYAEISRELLDTGDFITLHLNYVEYFHKPPLFYWLLAAVMAVFGPNEWALRALPAAAAFLMCLLTMAVGHRMFGEREGALALWVLATSLLPYAVGHYLVLDALFSLLLTATWVAWWMGFAADAHRSRRLWYLAGWAAMAMAVLTKGPVAVVLTACIVVVFLATQRQLRRLGEMAWLPGGALFLAVVLPWHVAVAMRHPDFLRFYLIVQHFGRFLGTTRQHVQPMWIMPAMAAVGMGTWALPMVAALVAAAGAALRRPAANTDSSCQASPALTYLLVWFLVVVGFFSLSRGKLPTYVLPACPAAALLTAWYLMRAYESRAVGWFAAATSALLAAVAAGLPVVAARQRVVPASQTSAWLLWTQAALLASAAALLVAIRRRGMMPLAWGLSLVLCAPGLVHMMSAIARYKTVGELVRPLAARLPHDVTVAQWHEYSPSLSFYLRRRVILVDTDYELRLGGQRDGQAPQPLRGEQTFLRLAREGPLLVSLRRRDWPAARQWGPRPVAANSKNVLLANDQLVELLGLDPWPEQALQTPARLLPPRYTRAP